MKKNSYYAFFDIDGTILNLTSMLSFLEYSLPKYYQPFSVYGYIKLKRYYLLREFFSDMNDRAALNKDYYKNYRGMKVEKLLTLGYEWFAQQLAENKNLFKENALKALRDHQRNGAEVVFVSGAFAPCIQPLADFLNVRHILCVKPKINNGFYNGEINIPQTIGEGKADAIKLFLINSPGVLKKSFAYGDHISDLAMLELVGTPIVIGGDQQLENHAIKHAWKII